MATKSDLISGMGVALSFVQGIVQAVKEIGPAIARLNNPNIQWKQILEWAINRRCLVRDDRNRAIPDLVVRRTSRRR